MSHATTAEQNLYASLRGHHQTDLRWKQPIAKVFCQEYTPRDSEDTISLVQTFARDHGFDIEDRSKNLGQVQTVADLLKLYSVLVKLAIGRPKTLFVLVPVVEVPTSLSVLEGMYALRMALLAGDFDILFRTSKTNLTRTRRYDLCLFQADNIVLASHQTSAELRRTLEDLVSECPLCLEPLTDDSCGQIVIPFKCRHAFHNRCIATLKRESGCPTCRQVFLSKGVVVSCILRE